ncbi:unnamed protein product [Tilletia laevis]|uniref:Uncharacterized protein n=1 Tax=Tilletia laevis TaxID=157183 RepID=A0A9N8LFE8_9BASI|nr:unnamed protein product [Tilletia laevis]CAD6975984.1 unnamed protein product [Tilletia controversa]
MSTALVLGAQLDPPPGPISSANTLRSQHTMPAPTAASSSQSHWSQPASTAAQHHSASAYSAYSSPASHSGMYASTSPHPSQHLSSYHSPAQQPQSHMGYTGYNHHHHQNSSAQHDVSEPPTPGTNSRAMLNGEHSPPESSHIPVTSMPSSTHSSAATGGLNIAGMLNQPVTSAATTSSNSYSARYGGSNQPSSVSHPDHQNGYFVPAPMGEMNGVSSQPNAQNMKPSSIVIISVHWKFGRSGAGCRRGERSVKGVGTRPFAGYCDMKR